MQGRGGPSPTTSSRRFAGYDDAAYESAMAKLRASA
jgi:hypothetical protein